MSALKKVLITIPENLLQEFDSLVNLENSSRSELVRRAAKMYIRERRKKELINKMKVGYEIMGPINLTGVSDALRVDNEQFKCYEERLTESE